MRFALPEFRVIPFRGHTHTYPELIYIIWGRKDDDLYHFYPLECIAPMSILRNTLLIFDLTTLGPIPLVHITIESRHSDLEINTKYLEY